MKKSILIALGAAVVTLTSCAKKDFAYNEKITDNFLQVMERTDKIDADVLAKNYEPAEEGTQFQPKPEKPAETFINYVKLMEEDSQNLEHSDKADKCHARVMQYFSDARLVYGAEYRNLLMAKDSAAQSHIAQKMTVIHEKLDRDVAETLAEQKKFFEAAGIQGQK